MTEPVNAGKLSVDVEADLTGFRRRLQQAVDKAASGIKASIGVAPDARQLRKDLRQAVDAARAGQEITVPVGLDDNAAAELKGKLSTAVGAASKGQKATVGTDVDAKDLPAKIRSEKTKAQRTVGSVKVPVIFDAKRGIAGLGKAIGLLKLPALAAAVGPVVAVIGALGAGLVAVASAAAPAVGLLGALPGAVAPLIQAFGGVKASVAGVGDAFKQVSSAQEKLMSGQKLTQDEAKKLKAALDNLSPSARRFVVDFTAVRPALTRLRKSMQEAFFAPFAGQVKQLATAYLPILRTQMSATAGIVGRAIGRFGQLAQTPLFKAQLSNVMENNNRALDTLSKAINPLARAFVSLLIAADPLVQKLAGLALDAARAAERFFTAGAASGRLQTFFNKAYNAAAQLGRIIVNLATGLFNVGKAASPLGGSLLNSFEKLTRKFAEFTGSVEGQNKLRAYFDAVRPTLTELGKLVGAIAKGVAKLGVDPSVAPLIAQIREQLGPAVLNLLTQLNGAFGPALVAGITAIVELFAAIAGAGGGGLTAFVETLTGFIKAVTWVIENVPYASTVLTAFFVAAGASKALMGIGGLIQKTALSIAGVGKAALGAAKGTKSFFAGLSGANAAASGAGRAGAQLRSMAVAAGKAAAALGRQAAAATASAFASLRAAAAAVAVRVGALAAAAGAAIWTAAQWLLNVAILVATSPITLIILAVAALVAIIVLIATKTTWFQTIWTTAWGFIRGVVVGLWNWLKANWPLVLAILTGPFGLAVLFIVRNWDKIVGFVKALPGRIASAAAGMWNAITRAAGDAKDWVVRKLSEMVTWVGGLGAKIGRAASGMWDGIKAAFKGAINGLIGLWNNLRIPGFGIDFDKGPVHIHVRTPEINFPDIPLLAAGGVVKARRGGTLAVLGEGGQDEAVIPLTDGGLTRSTMVDRLTAALTAFTAALGGPAAAPAAAGIGGVLAAAIPGGPTMTAARAAAGGTGATVNVYPQPQQSEEEIAAKVTRRLGRQVGVR